MHMNKIQQEAFLSMAAPQMWLHNLSCSLKRGLLPATGWHMHMPNNSCDQTACRGIAYACMYGPLPKTRSKKSKKRNPHDMGHNQTHCAPKHVKTARMMPFK